jgi:hypothetical protein
VKKTKYLFLLVLLLFAILLLDLSAFSDEQKKKLLIKNGWRLELTDALLTKEVGNVVTGGLHALPGKSVLILYFNVRYIKDDRQVESIEKIIMKNAVILDARTGNAATCPSIKKIRSSFATERGKSTDSETQYMPSPSTRTLTKKGRVTRISYIACVGENNKNLLFVLPNFGTLELETLIHEKESLWQGPLPDSPLYLEKSKD